MNVFIWCLRSHGTVSIIGSRFVPNARRTCTYIRSVSTSNFTSFKIIGNYSKTRKLGSIWTDAEKRWTLIFHVWNSVCQAWTKGFSALYSHWWWKLIHYDNPKRKKSWGPPGHTSASTAEPNIHGKKLLLCIWWDQLVVVYYELLKPNETITEVV